MFIENKKYLLGGLFISFVPSSIRFIDNTDSWVIDILSHFPVQYAFLALFLLTICLWKRHFFLALLAAMLFAINISALSDSYSFAMAEVQKNKSFKIYSANINKSNTDYSKIVNELTGSDADILIILEATEKNIKYLQPVITSYPYKVVNLNSGVSGTGTVLLSRFPILNHITTKYSEFGNMLVSAMLKVDDMKIALYAVHFPKPIYIQEFSLRSKQFLSLADQIGRQKERVILAGDFNTSPYSPLYKKLLKISGLKDTRKGFGWLPSWPVAFPLLWIPIDHILVSQDIQVHSRTNGPYIGSDHYPVYAELSFN